MRDAGDPRTPADRIPLLVVAAILGLGTLVRLPLGDPGSLDGGEYSYVADVEEGLAATGERAPAGALLAGIQRGHQPLALLPIAALRSLGLPATGGRWLALVLSAGGLWIASRLFPRLLGEGTEPGPLSIAALAWLAFSPLAIRYGFDVTPNALLALLVWGQALAVYRGVDGDEWAWIWAALLGVAAFFTDYLAVPACASILVLGWAEAHLTPVARRRRTRVRAVLAALILGLALAAWAPILGWALPRHAHALSVEAAHYRQDLSTLDQLAYLLGAATGIPLVATLALAVLALGVMAFEEDRRHSPPWFLAIPIVALVTQVAVRSSRYRAATGGLDLAPHQVLPYLPFVLAVLVRGLDVLARQARSSLRLVALALPAVCALVVATGETGRVRRPDLGPALDHVRGSIRDWDAIGVLSTASDAPRIVHALTGGRRSYHDGVGYWALARAGSGRGAVVWVVADRSQGVLPAAYERHSFRRLWLIEIGEEEFGSPLRASGYRQRVVADLTERHRLVDRRELDQIAVSLFELEHSFRPWPGDEYRLDLSDSDWSTSGRQVSWLVNPEGIRSPIRLDLPPPPRSGPVDVWFGYPPDLERPVTRARVAVDGAPATSFTLGPREAVVRFRIDALEEAGPVVTVVFQPPPAELPAEVRMRMADG